MMRDQIEIEKNNATVANKVEGNCPGCGRHCPLSAPHCGKGEAYARMQLEGREGEVPQEREFPKDREDRGGRRSHGRQGEDGAFEERRERGEGNHPWDKDHSGSEERDSRGGRREHGRQREGGAFEERRERGEGDHPVNTDRNVSEEREGHRGRHEHGRKREDGAPEDGGEKGDHHHRHWYENSARGGERRGPHAGREHGRGEGEFRHGEEEGMPSPDDHPDSLSIRLRLASDRILRSGGRKHGQERILEILKTQDGISQRDLLYALHIQPGSLTEILNKLEAAGEIERVPDEEDKRRQLVKLTEEGRKKAESLSGEEQQDPYAVLSEEEKKTLSDLLDKLIDSTEDEG